MPPSAVNWTPGLIFAAIGIALGVVFLLLRRRKSDAEAAPVAPPIEVRDLATRRDVLLDRLRELADAPGNRTAEQLASERSALELEAARVVRALDERQSAVATQHSRPEPQRSGSAMVGFAWGALSMAAVGGLVYAVSRRATPRSEGAPVTGSMGGASEGTTAIPADEGAMRAAIEKNPADLDARRALIRALLAKRDMMGLFEQTQAMQQISPGNPEALSYEALVRLDMGQPETARKMLEGVIKAEPDLANAYFHLAIVLTRMGRAKDAEEVIAKAAAHFPDQADLFKKAYARMSADLASAPPLPAETDNPHADIPVKDPASATGPRGGQSSGASTIAGTIDIDPALRSGVAPGAILFIAVREAGMDKGPPAAVKRLVVDAFPVAFSLTSADSMAGEGLPESMRVDARVDSDGNAATRDPNDPHAFADNVGPGRADLRLTLKR